MSDKLNIELTKQILEAYELNPEEVLDSLGFGLSKQDNILTKIPSRFLQPSNLKGIDVKKFLNEQIQLNGADNLPLQHIIALKKMKVLPESFELPDGLGKKLLLQISQLNNNERKL